MVLFDKNYDRSQEYHTGHLAEDYLTPLQTPVLNPVGGTVTYQTDQYGGNYNRIYLGDPEADRNYFVDIVHLSESIKTGNVAFGEEISKSGNSGLVTIYKDGEWITTSDPVIKGNQGAHTHVGVKYGYEWVKPSYFFLVTQMMIRDREDVPLIEKYKWFEYWGDIVIAGFCGLIQAWDVMDAVESSDTTYKGWYLHNSDSHSKVIEFKTKHPGKNVLNYKYITL